MRIFKTYILGLIAFLSGLSASGQGYESKESIDNNKKQNEIILNPGDRFKVFLNHHVLYLNYFSIRSKLSSYLPETYDGSIGVRINEEESVIDLGVSDQHIITVPFGDIQNAPPNMSGTEIW